MRCHIIFLHFILKNNVIEHNIIVYMKNVEFFKHIFPLMVNEQHTHIHIYIYIYIDSDVEDLRINKRQRKEFFFGNDFYTYLVKNNSRICLEVFYAPNAKHWNKASRIKIDSIKKKKYMDFNRFFLRSKTHWL